MARSNRKDAFSCEIEKVWSTVTNLDQYAWRSDISRIEIKSKKQFVEYTKDGYATTFTITAAEPYRRLEFDIENNNMSGHWTGIFTREGTNTVIDFTEEVVVKKLLMKPFAGLYLKKQQAAYTADLKAALEG